MYDVCDYLAYLCETRFVTALTRFSHISGPEIEKTRWFIAITVLSFFSYRAGPSARREMCCNTRTPV